MVITPAFQAGDVGSIPISRFCANSLWRTELARYFSQ